MSQPPLAGNGQYLCVSVQSHFRIYRLSHRILTPPPLNVEGLGVWMMVLIPTGLTPCSSPLRRGPRRPRGGRGPLAATSPPLRVSEGMRFCRFPILLPSWRQCRQVFVTHDISVTHFRQSQREEQQVCRTPDVPTAQPLQQRPHPGACLKCRLSGRTLDPLHQQEHVHNVPGICVNITV